MGVHVAMHGVNTYLCVALRQNLCINFVKSGHRAPHVVSESSFIYRALEVQGVRLRARRLASGVLQARLPAASCDQLLHFVA